MDKKTLTERDIITKLIFPALEKRGWNLKTQALEEFAMSNGRVIVKGNRQQAGLRGKGERADIVLFYKHNIPIAVIEAKRNNKKALGTGIQQAIHPHGQSKLDITAGIDNAEVLIDVDRCDNVKVALKLPARWTRPIRRSAYRGRWARSSATERSASHHPLL